MGEILGIGSSHGPQPRLTDEICLAGAMEGRQAQILAWAETYIFNSWCVALFPPPVPLPLGEG